MSSPRAPAATIEAPRPVRASRGILRLVSRVRIAVMDALDAELAPFDISAAQMMVLGTVATGEADSAAGLCRGISYDPGAMTRMIDRLEQKGLLRRVPRPDDRRAQSLELTIEGKALYPKLAAAKEAVQARFLRGFSDDEQQMFERLLTRMLANR